jgi:MFS family permease
VVLEDVPSHLSLSLFFTMSSHQPPIGLAWRSSTSFIITTMTIGIFTDQFLYGLIVPVLPFLLRDRISIPEHRVQAYSSALLAAYAGASVLFSLPAGWIADRTASRRSPFLAGIATLLAATVMLLLGQSMIVLMAARILQGMSAAVVWTVGLAMVMDTVGVEHLGKVMGSILSIISVGILAAPLLGGVLYEKTGFVGLTCLSVGLLVIDLLMRLLLIEKKSANRLTPSKSNNTNSQRPRSGIIDADEEDDEHHQSVEAQPSSASEHDQLLPKPTVTTTLHDYTILPPYNPIIRTLPILYCLRSPRLLTALLLCFIQALILGSFDATIPTETQSLFSFTPLQSGLLFIAPGVPDVIFGPLAGAAVDRYGARPIAVAGFALLAPVIVALRLPHAIVAAAAATTTTTTTTILMMTTTTNSDRIYQITLYSCLLALCGVGMGIIGSPAIVEASEVIRNFDEANRDRDLHHSNANANAKTNTDDGVEATSREAGEASGDEAMRKAGLFGPNGPYAQLYGLQSMVYSAGLTVGPVLAGTLRDTVGYGNMNLVVGGMAGVTAVVAGCFMGERTRGSLTV